VRGFAGIFLLCGGQSGVLGRLGRGNTALTARLSDRPNFSLPSLSTAGTLAVAGVQANAPPTKNGIESLLPHLLSERQFLQSLQN